MITHHRTFDGRGGLLGELYVVESGLDADRRTVPADGVTPAVLHYASATDAGPHAWTINGAAHSEPATFDAASGLSWSEVEVTAAAPGPIDITVGGNTLTVEAI